jgi:hypothetical protein
MLPTGAKSLNQPQCDATHCVKFHEWIMTAEKCPSVVKRFYVLNGKLGEGEATNYFNAYFTERKSTV